MPEPQKFLRGPDPTPKRTLYTDAMEIFHRAADTIGLAPRAIAFDSTVIPLAPIVIPFEPITSGFDLVANLDGFPRAVREALIVVTGQGRLDATSFSGKVVGSVLAAISPMAQAPSA